MCNLNMLSDYDVFTFLIYLFVYLSASAGVTIAAEPQFVLISDDDIKNLKVDQLRQELKARVLDILVAPLLPLRKSHQTISYQYQLS